MSMRNRFHTHSYSFRFITLEIYSYLHSYTYIKMNVCLYMPFRIVKYAFDHVMIFSKIVAYEPTKVSELVWPIFDRWSHWKLLKIHFISLTVHLIMLWSLAKWLSMSLLGFLSWYDLVSTDGATENNSKWMES